MPPKQTQSLQLPSTYTLAQKTNAKPITPAVAAALPRGDRAALCRILEAKGGSSLYTAADAAKAFAFVV